MWMAPAAIVLGLALGELAVIFVDAVGAAAGSSFTHPTPAVNIVGNVVVDLAFVAAAVYLARLRGAVRPVDFGFRRVSLRRGFAAFMIAGVGYYGLTAVYAQLIKLHGQDKLPSELGVSKSDAALVAAAVFVCVIAPIAEEFFFRGFLFGCLRRWRVRVAGYDLGPWIASLIVGILFGLAHTGSASAQYLVPLGIPRIRAVSRALANPFAVPVHRTPRVQQLACARGQRVALVDARDLGSRRRLGARRGCDHASARRSLTEPGRVSPDLLTTPLARVRADFAHEM